MKKYASLRSISAFLYFLGFYGLKKALKYQIKISKSAFHRNFKKKKL